MKKTMAALVAVLLMTASAVSSGEPLRFGFCQALTGDDMVMGALARQGAELALQDLNPPNGTGIGGRTIEAVF